MLRNRGPLKVDMLGELGPYVVDAYGRKPGDVGEEVGLGSLSLLFTGEGESSMTRTQPVESPPGVCLLSSRLALYLPDTEPLVPSKDVLGADEELYAVPEERLDAFEFNDDMPEPLIAGLLVLPIRSRGTRV